MAELSVALFSIRPHEREALARVDAGAGLDLRLHEARLDPSSVALAAGCGAISCGPLDQLDEPVLDRLQDLGVGLVSLRCVGFNHIDIGAAARRGIAVARVPAYPPHAIAEHAVALILSVARGTHRAFNRVREGNLSHEGLMGLQLHGSTAAVIGTGRIGGIVASILVAFGCRVLACDPVVNPACRVTYADLRSCLSGADVVSLHCPLTPRTAGMIDHEALALMRRGALLVNTSRGGLLDLAAITAALDAGRLGGLGLDLYEEDEGLMRDPRPTGGPLDPALERLQCHRNVLITAHQACSTTRSHALIARTTIGNLTDYARGDTGVNVLAADDEP